MDLKPALQLIQDTAVKAAGAELVTLPHEDRFTLVKVNGALERYDREPPRWAHEVLSIWALTDIAKELRETDATVDLSVWHSRAQVVLIHDRARRRDKVTFKLQESSCVQALDAMKDDDFTQQDLIHLLRVKMVDAHLDELVLILRSLNFRTSQSLQSDHQHASSSMGKSIAQELATKNAEKPLPEGFSFSSEFWSNLPDELSKSIVAQFAVAIDVDFSDATFKLTPHRDGCIRASLWAHDQLATWLREQLPPDVPVYYGTP